MRFIHRILIIFSLFFITSCQISPSSPSYITILKQAINDSIPKISKNYAIPRIIYHYEEDFSQIDLIDLDSKKRYMLEYRDRNIIILTTEDMIDSDIVKELDCQTTVASLNIDPRSAIATVNAKKKVNAELAIFAPSLQKGDCKAIWSVHGPNSVYEVNTLNGEIDDGHQTK